MAVPFSLRAERCADEKDDDAGNHGDHGDDLPDAGFMFGLLGGLFVNADAGFGAVVFGKPAGIEVGAGSQDDENESETFHYGGFLSMDERASHGWNMTGSWGLVSAAVMTTRHFLAVFLDMSTPGGNSGGIRNGLAAHEG